MNKKQLIVAWITGLLVSFVCLNPPRYGYRRIDFVRTILHIIPILIIGILLIFTLRNDDLVRQIKIIFGKIKGFFKLNFKKIKRIAKRELIILSVIIGLGIGIGFSSRLFPPLPERHSINEGFGVLSESELKDMDLCLDRVIEYCAIHPEIKRGYNLSDLEIAKKMAKENPNNQIIYDKLNAISEKIQKSGKFDLLSSVVVEDKRTFLVKTVDRVSYFIENIFRSEKIAGFGVFIILFGYPVLLFIRFIIWTIKTRKIKSA